MAVSHDDMNKSARRRERYEFPWSHVTGYILSVLLTASALWLVVARAGAPVWILSVILLLASLQIFVQLFFFMHVAESRGPGYHVWALTLAAVFTLTVVLGSIWIMSFGGNMAY